ncbi:ankyrin repeat protein [Colletotrichum plurivorum]|uniref:Ankyrin repeat protein n=1 Tax=Colletotrichum plurivorum TaxID=2175906 RepID=A0A8H6K5T8_9PEZI|nr:ankyrin repeat protein [Colletotrichum plurivorum]
MSVPEGRHPGVALAEDSDDPQPVEKPTISSSAHKCDNSFATLCEDIQASPYRGLANALTDEAARFKRAANIKALRPSESPKSLDSRLKTVDRVAQSVLSGLDRLEDALNRDLALLTFSRSQISFDMIFLEDALSNMRRSPQNQTLVLPTEEVGDSSPEGSTHSVATSFATDTSDGDRAGRKIYQLTDIWLDGVQLGYNQHIECPYCRTSQFFKDVSQWMHHVYRDLGTYVCTFKDCPTEPFSTSHEWFKHELDCHRRQWKCILCHSRCISASGLESHFLTRHSSSISAAQRRVMLKACERAITHFDKTSCSFCNEWNPQVSGDNNSNGFRSHMARHLQELSRVALPLAIEGLEIKEQKIQTESEYNNDEEMPEDTLKNDSKDTPKVPDDNLNWFPLAKRVSNVDDQRIIDVNPQNPSRSVVIENHTTLRRFTPPPGPHILTRPPPRIITQPPSPGLRHHPSFPGDRLDREHFQDSERHQIDPQASPIRAVPVDKEDIVRFRALERAERADREQREREEKKEEEDKEAQRRRLMERLMPRRRSFVGSRRHRVLHEDGVYRWE